MLTQQSGRRSSLSDSGAVGRLRRKSEHPLALGRREDRIGVSSGRRERCRAQPMKQVASVRGASIAPPMALDATTILAQIDDLLARYDAENDEERPAWVQLRTRLLAAIERLAPADSAYVRDAHDARHARTEWYVSTYASILRALRADIAAGYLRSVEELVHADVFADFLAMAEELQRADYKDAAAVIAGSTLEEHLRKLALKNQIAVDKPDGSPKKADTLNADLAKVPVYNKLVQKSVTAWLDFRNSAAHGKYGEYDGKQVAALIRDVRDFAARYPA
jgi:hypothetical protein